MARDQIYMKPKSGDAAFSFNDEVVSVFDDMISRSVPHYQENLPELVAMACHGAIDHTSIYDLGCSIGAVLFPLSEALRERPLRIVGVDNSPAMIAKLAEKIEASTLASFKRIEFECLNLQEVRCDNASVIMLNYTLQFVPFDQREGLLEKLYEALVPGGILLLSEKVIHPDESLNQWYIDRHHAFKKSNGYSELEISQKRQALEDVLVAESLQVHTERLTSIGFNPVDTWDRRFNFASIYARKPLSADA